MQLNQIYFERLKELATWLAVRAQVKESNVLVKFMADGEIRLTAIASNEVQYDIRISGDQISYHTNQYINI